jgi:hypothetical protein
MKKLFILLPILLFACYGPSYTPRIVIIQKVDSITKDIYTTVTEYTSNDCYVLWQRDSRMDEPNLKELYYQQAMEFIKELK